MAFAAASLGFRQEPMSIEEIMAEAESMLREYNPIIPLRFWLRSADAIQKQAQSYERHGNEEEAFKFYYRHALLVMNKLAKHPDTKLAENRAAWKKARGDVNANLARLEALRPNIKKRYEQYLKLVEQQRLEREKWRKEQPVDNYGNMTGAMDGLSLRHSDGMGYGRARELDPSSNAELAVRLAHNEYRGNRNARASRLSSSTSSNRSPRSQKLRPVVRETFFGDDSDDDLSKNIQSVGQRRQHAFSGPPERSTSQRSAQSSPKASRAPQYPTVPKQAKRDSSWYESRPSTPESRTSPKFQHASISQPPVRPPKESSNGDAPPPLPGKVLASPTRSAAEALSESHDDTLNPRDYAFKTTSKTESGAPLRTVFLNPKLRSRFLTIALANTQRNLETCGILCGELISNAFFISKLVIPEQESTSDTCDTVNEGALFDYCDAENLMTLGWIHTHPTQTCFMSSRDLHTHGGYQVQLAESIAIVCAPKHEPAWGCFRLTDPPGLGAILNCKQTGLFHPHGERDIYTDPLSPGHVREVENLPFDVVDLRPNSSWI